jgi:hypothetical protein
MLTLISEHYVLQPVTVADLQLASLAWGFTIGFGFLTTWNAIRQTADIYRRYGYMKFNSPYVVMIWLEILVCLIFSVICWLHLNAIIPPRHVSIILLYLNTRLMQQYSFAFYFVIRMYTDVYNILKLLTSSSHNLGPSSTVLAPDHHQQSLNSSHESSESYQTQDRRCRSHHGYQHICLLHLGPRKTPNFDKIRRDQQCLGSLRESYLSGS